MLEITLHPDAVIISKKIYFSLFCENARARFKTEYFLSVAFFSRFRICELFLTFD